jgi:hypothetical protein
MKKQARTISASPVNKVITFLLSGVSVLAATISILIRNMRSRSKSTRYIARISEGKIDLAALEKELFCTRATKAFQTLPGENDLQQWLEELVQPGKKLGRFAVKLVKPLGGSKFFLVVHAEEVDFVPVTDTRSRDIIRLDFFSAVLKPGPQEKQLGVYSDIHENLEGKHSREEFGRLLLDHISNKA